MNSNSYLGMALREEVIAAEGHAGRAFGAGPGAVRFISGSYAPHVELERRLAAFHGREAALVFQLSLRYGHGRPAGLEPHAGHRYY